MSIRFAAPPQAITARMTRMAARTRRRRAANDNGCGEASATMLRASLRHFAEHGLAAARHARVKAESAHAAGDRQAYEWWFGICQTLDRPMARALSASTASRDRMSAS